MFVELNWVPLSTESGFQVWVSLAPCLKTTEQEGRFLSRHVASMLTEAANLASAHVPKPKTPKTTLLYVQINLYNLLVLES